MAFNFKNLFSGKSKESGNFYQYLRGDAMGTLGSKFAKDIFTQTVRDMHEEFRQCKMAYLQNSLVHSSAKTMTDLMLGDGFDIETDNPVQQKFLLKYLIDSGLDVSIKAAVEDYIVTGNGYIEVMRNKQGEATKFLPFTNAEDIYIDFDYRTNKVKRYIQRVLTSETTIKGAKQFVLLTPQGRVTVHGIEIPKESIIHIKNGNNIFGVYGRSDIASVLDDLRILDVIERAVAVIARYKAVPKQMLAREVNQDEDAPSEEELKIVGDKMKNLSDFENPIVNGKWTILNLSSGGNDIRLEGYIDYLKRKITVAMAPEFLIHGQEVNRATSREQKQTYFLRLKSMRYNPEMVVTSILQSIIHRMSKTNKTLIGEFMFKFGQFDIILPEEREQILISRYSTGIITIAEARQELDLPEVPGTDLFNWEVSSGPAMGVPGEGLENVKTARKSKNTESKKTKRSSSKK